MTLMIVIVIAIIVFIFLSLIWKLISKGKTIINIKDNTITRIQSNRFSTYFNENESDTYSLEKVRIKYIHFPCLEQIYIGETHPLIINKCSLSRKKYHELKEIIENRCGKENINTKYRRKDFVTIISIILLVFIIVKVFY